MTSGGGFAGLVATATIVDDDQPPAYFISARASVSLLFIPPDSD